MQPPLDILFIHHLPVMGGATQSLLGLVKFMQQQGLRCKVLFLQHQGNAIERYRQEGIDVILNDRIYSYAHAYGAYNKVVSRRPWRVVTNLIKAFRSTETAKQVIAAEQPRVVYLNTSVLIPCARAAHQLKIPVIWHLREQLHNGYLGIRKKLVRQLFAKYANRIIAISKVNAHTLHVEGTEVIYNSVDFSVFNKQLDAAACKQQYQLTGDFIFSFIGGSVLSKGADMLVDAFLQVWQQHRDSQLVIAGHFNTDPTKPMNRIEKKVHEVCDAHPTLKTAIRFTGPLPQVTTLLAASDVLLWPATTPHFARPIMEAMVMGKPVIASQFLSSAEIIDHQQEGLLVKPTSSAFAEAMVWMLTHSKERQQMGASGYEKASHLFNAAENNQRIYQTLQSLLK